MHQMKFFMQVPVKRGDCVFISFTHYSFNISFYLKGLHRLSPLVLSCFTRANS
jgi:hypothetical protein